MIDDGHLTEDQAIAVSAGAQQVRVRGPEAPRSAQSLAVQGDAIHPAFGAVSPGGAYLLQPSAEQELDLVDVHAAQQPMQCRLTGTPTLHKKESS
jgi:hypothetical protein